MREDTRALLLAMYEQAHDHFRDTHRKRDQVVAFYIAVLAATLGAWDRLAPDGLTDLVAAATSVMGLFTLFLITHYRKWHIILGGAWTVLQRLLANEDEPTVTRCEAIWNEVNDPPLGIYRLMLPLRGVEAALFMLVSFLAFVPMQILLQRSGWGIVVVSSPAAAYTGNACLFWLVTAGLAGVYLRNHQRFPRHDWIFRWLPSASAVPERPASVRGSRWSRFWQLLLGGSRRSVQPSEGDAVPAPSLKKAPIDAVSHHGMAKEA